MIFTFLFHRKRFELDDLIPKDSYELPKDILDYINAAAGIDNSDNDSLSIEELKSYIKECGGFRSLPDNLKQELVKFSKSLPEDEETVFRLYFGITYDDEIIAIKHIIEQNLTIEQFEKLRKKSTERLKFKEDDSE